VFGAHRRLRARYGDESAVATGERGSALHWIYERFITISVMNTTRVCFTKRLYGQTGQQSSSTEGHPGRYATDVGSIRVRHSDMPKTPCIESSPVTGHIQVNYCSVSAYTVPSRLTT
jgi:hypothetical protein